MSVFKGRNRENKIKNTIARLTGIEGIAAEMLKYGEAVDEWMLFISGLIWKQMQIPGEWKTAINVDVVVIGG